MTELVVEGVGNRSVSYDGAIGRFTVSVLRDSLITAVSDGNRSVQAIAAEVAKQCTETEPETADHTAPPTCISPNGLQTVSIRIREEFDWTDQGRVSLGFLYENRLSIAIRGTGFAGGLVDMVITSGGDDVRFEGLDFTVSRRAEFERLALLDAIDDAQATARAIAGHMGYEIVRIVRITPVTGYDPYRRVEEPALSLTKGQFPPIQLVFTNLSSLLVTGQRAAKTTSTPSFALPCPCRPAAPAIFPLRRAR